MPHKVYGETLFPPLVLPRSGSKGIFSARSGTPACCMSFFITSIIL